MMINTIKCANYQIPLVGLGTFTLKGNRFYNILENAVQLGYQLIDTAHKYHNERVIGKMNNSPEQVMISSKICAGQIYGNLSLLYLNKMSVLDAFNLSSNKVGRNLDVFLLHSPFRGFEYTYFDLIKIRKQGLVKIIGVCNCNKEHLNKIYNLTGEYPMINQIEIHPYNYPLQLIDFCKNKGIIVEARSPFAHGDALHEWLENSDLLNIALKYNKTIPQIILRWLTQQEIIALPRTSSLIHLKENIDIFDFTLTDVEMNFMKSLNKNKSYGYKSVIR